MGASKRRAAAKPVRRDVRAHEYGASSTSMYTTTEKQESYPSLENILERHCKDEMLRKVIVEMLDCCADIT